MKRLKILGRRAFDKLRGPEVVRWTNRHALRILMYHRFPNQGLLAKQCDYLQKHYNLLSLDQVADYLETGRPFPANSTAVTVDDGYRDFLDVAYPIFSRCGIPITLFVVT